MSNRPTRTGLHGFIEELKKEILEETKRAYGEKAFHRWLKPLFEVSLEDPDGNACLIGSCGHTMEILLKFEGEYVSQSAY